MLSSNVLSVILTSGLINLVALVITTFIMIFYCRMPAYHLMSIYVVYFFLGFVMRPLQLYQTGYSEVWQYVGRVPDIDSLIWSEVLILVGHMAMVLGFFSLNWGRLVAEIPPGALRPARPILFILVASVFLLAGAYASWIQFGALNNVQSTLAIDVVVDAQGGQRLQGASGYQTIFEELLPLTLITLFMWPRTRRTAIALILGYIAYRALVGAGRHKFVLLSVGLGMIMLIQGRRRFPNVPIVLAALLLLVMFNFVGADRLALRKAMNGDLKVSELLSNAKGSEPRSATDYTAEYDTLTALAFVIPERTGYSYGTQYLRLLIWPIPRFLWQDKPVYTTNFNITSYGNYQFLSTTLFIDSYMCLGTLSLFSIVYIVSLGLCMAYNAASSNKNSAFKFLFYVVMIFFSPLLLRDGIVMAAYAILVSSAGAAVLCYSGEVRYITATRTSSRRRKSLSAMTHVPKGGSAS